MFPWDRSRPLASNCQPSERSGPTGAFVHPCFHTSGSGALWHRRRNSPEAPLRACTSHIDTHRWARFSPLCIAPAFQGNDSYSPESSTSPLLISTSYFQLLDPLVDLSEGIFKILGLILKRLYLFLRRHGRSVSHRHLLILCSTSFSETLSAPPKPSPPPSSTSTPARAEAQPKASRRKSSPEEGCSTIGIHCRIRRLCKPKGGTSPEAVHKTGGGVTGTQTGGSPRHGPHAHGTRSVSTRHRNRLLSIWLKLS